ncbi:MAG: oxidoreductase molybdopterin binding protein [Methylococcaceae bacterium NSP1-2]|nr:molybdopterin-dependent oxidoreductase [Methylococcaceae bacterium]OYV21016.1 MAG: oxidoreductase molybdopterin binding protein [Methylococcaceae bacterium NSP1-2]
MMNRRCFIKKTVSSLVALSGWSVLQQSALAADSKESPTLDALEGKKPLIKQTFRPPNYETPVNYFDAAFTPNDAFFVRYHHAQIPKVNVKDWRLQVGGDALSKPLEFTLEQLRNEFEIVEIAALCLCAGNRRSSFQPPATGIQWGSGAMGNARWRGVRLRDVLARANLDKTAVEVSFDGTDSGILRTTPDFIKSLPLAKALDENTLIAFEMNGEPLPHWNGFPARLIVAGWVATYWIKHLTAINVLSKPADNFWMKTAYRLPKDRFTTEQFDSQVSDTTIPITDIVVNSLITNLTDEQVITGVKPLEIKGVAWDGGDGITGVEISTDAGHSWQQAALMQNYGRFSWRHWRYQFTPKAVGEYSVMARASSHSGNSQPLIAVANPSGYHHNAVQKITIKVV